MAMRRSVFSAGLLALMAMGLGGKPGSVKINDEVFDNPEGRERLRLQKEADAANCKKFPNAKQRAKLGLAKPVHVHQDRRIPRYRRKHGVAQAV